MTADLEACCLRCLRKNPWRRFYRAYDLLKRLQILLEAAGDAGRGRKSKVPPLGQEDPRAS